VVVWLPDARVLFGTCLVRAASARSLGNLADASVGTWEAAVEAIERRFPSPRVVVPGHGDPGDASLLAHTKALARAGR
jgi:glyoxylase-like metal-dependent hydrolase (beta-lactamase superfamily II)